MTEDKELLRLWTQIEAKEGKLLPVLKQMDKSLYDTCEDIYRRFYQMPMDAVLPKREMEWLHRQILNWQKRGLSRAEQLKLYMRDLQSRSRVKTREALFLCLLAAFVEYYLTLARVVEKPLLAIAQQIYMHTFNEAQQLTEMGTAMPPGVAEIAALLEDTQPDGDSFYEAVFYDAQYRAHSTAKQIQAGGLWEELRGRLEESLKKHRQWVLQESKRTGSTLNRYTGYLDRTVGYVVGYTIVQAMVDAGVKSYRFIAVLDERTTDACRKLHGKVFDIKDLKMGVNAPPVYPPPHPCRSIIRPVATSKR